MYVVCSSSPNFVRLQAVDSRLTHESDMEGREYQMWEKHVISKVSCHHERKKKKRLKKMALNQTKEPFLIDFTILSNLSVIMLGGINECLAAK